MLWDELRRHFGTLSSASGILLFALGILCTFWRDVLLLNLLIRPQSREGQLRVQTPFMKFPGRRAIISESIWTTAARFSMQPARIIRRAQLSESHGGAPLLRGAAAAAASIAA